MDQCKKKEAKTLQKLNSNNNKDPLGFRKNIRIREVILTLRILIEKQIRNRNIFILFVNFEKAFDNIQLSKLFYILKNIGIKYYG